MESQDRRSFIKKTCSLCVSLVGLGAIASELSSCKTLPVSSVAIKNGYLEVSSLSFAPESNVLIVRNDKLEWDIALIRVVEPAPYRAFQMKCTHQDNPLTATSSGFFCSSHGSAFDFAGNVTKEPALNPLKSYQVSVDGDLIRIKL